MALMQADDALVQRVYEQVRAELSPAARERTQHVHIYPSRRCTYTIAKERIFVRVRDGDDNPLPECVLRHVILHARAGLMTRTAPARPRAGTHDQPVPRSRLRFLGLVRMDSHGRCKLPGTGAP
jgi:hypothetical protein